MQKGLLIRMGMRIKEKETEAAGPDRETAPERFMPSTTSLFERHVLSRFITFHI